MARNALNDFVNTLTALDAMPGGVVVYRADKGKEILYANKKLYEIYGCEDYDEFLLLTNGTFRGMVHEDDLAKVEKTIELQINSENNQFDHVTYRIVTNDGSIRKVDDYGRLINIPDVGDVFYVFIIDTDTKYLTYDLDILTGLPGQKKFLESAANVLRQDEQNPLSPERVFLYFNLNKFKLINIKYGSSFGDAILKDIAELLKNEFPDDLVARFGDDHFVVLATNDEIDEKVENMYSRLRNRHEEDTLDGTVGAYVVKENDIDPYVACNLAKLACEQGRKQAGTVVTYYTEEIGSQIDEQYYIVNHLDEALEKGYIRVYCQPVVRSISGALCGAEALARWIAPERGVISPGKFIPILEDAHLIHKLDMFMIKTICKGYQTCIEHNVPIVPVSINLSRLDFVLTDIRQYINHMIEEYKVPRSLINIEITESAFVEDDGQIQDQIMNFRREGFQVWMDDFGSGYSSLNILKDYDFDELKIDMAFLSNFNQKARDIIEATIRMAKQIKIQTLAEGVETREQYSFLKAIGCEKIQGYFFGKPMPYKDMLKHCIENDMKIETRAWASYYDKIGSVNFMTEQSMAIFEDDGQNIHFLFANQPYREVLRSAGTRTLKKAEENINARGTSMQYLFRKLANSLSPNGKPSTVTYPAGDQYLSVTVRIIAHSNGRRMVLANLANITRDSDFEMQRKRDRLIRNIFYLYDTTALVDYEKDTIEFYDSKHCEKLDHKKGIVYGVEEYIHNDVMQLIFPADRDICEKFFDKESLKQRITDSHEGFVTEYFRLRGIDGNYRWHICTILQIPKMDGNVYLMLTRESGIEKLETRNRLLAMYEDNLIYQQDPVSSELTDFSDASLWQNLKQNSNMKIFWKDKDRRFVGVTRSFLKYYGMKSEDEIIGKTDEDMRWHVSDEPCKNDEEEILTTGIHTHNAPGKCIIKGVLHNIMTSKMPIYRDGKIVGLCGYLVDVEEENGEVVKQQQSTTVDLATGLANVRGIIEDFAAYGEEFAKNDIDFAAVNIIVDGYDEFNKAYGEKNGNELLYQIADILRMHFGTSASLGRVLGSRFVVLHKCPEQAELSKTLRKVKRDISQLTFVNDHVCTLFPKVTTVYAGNSKNIEHIMATVIGVGKNK